ncbi:MAG: methionyl-tRNA formyltransferase [Gammaproteobacteria bacterium]|nr:methionyl-tRNA formyltransferase [Gammaproteobacteria bacterium]
MLNIIFAGTPDFSVIALKALLATEHNIIAAFTQPDRPSGRGQQLSFSPVKQVALENNIAVFQPQNFKSIEEQKLVTDLNADMMIVVAYGIILPKVILEAPKYGCLNIHASLLPRWRGAAPIQRAILAGDKVSGITIMQMDEGLDTGDMLFTHECELEETETGASLHDKLAMIGGEAIVKTLENYHSLYQQKIKQNSDLAIYAKKLTKQEAQIDWSDNAINIKNQINGFNSWPVAYTVLGNKNIRIWCAHVNQDKLIDCGSTVGEVIQENKKGIVVQCGDGQLCITELQMPGKKRISARDFVNSRSLLKQAFSSP